MQSIPDYFSSIATWGQAAFINNNFFNSDSAYYLSDQLTASQRTDLGVLLQTLQTTDSNKIHIRCADWHQTNELFGPVLASLCFYKYAQNQTETPFNELYKSGTVLYHPANEEVRVVTGRHETGIRTRPIKEKTVRVKGEKHTQTKTFNPTFKQVAKYIPLANIAEHTYNRNALGNLADYFDLFSRTLQRHRALTQFPRRLLVVAPHATIEQLPAGSQLPIRYQFNRHYTVPVVSPLVEIVNNYADARERLRTDNSLDEVVILGDIGYRDSLNDLLNDLDDGYFRRVIIMGSQPIQTDYGFQLWPWSRDERTWLRTGRINQFERICLSADGLKDLRPMFVEPARQLTALGLSEAEATGAINRLISLYLREVVFDVASQLSYQRSLLYDPESVWRSWFAEANQLDAYPAFCASLMSGLGTVADYVAKTPAKRNKIIELAQQKPGICTYVVVRSRQVEALNQSFADFDTIKAISYQELKTHLKTAITGQSEQFIFPSLRLNYQPGGQLLRDYYLYRRALERGPGYLLTYEGIEEGLANLCQWLYERDENRNLTYPDRQHWISIPYTPTALTNIQSTGTVGMLQTIPPAEVQAIGALIDELETLTDESPDKPNRTAEVLLKLNESFTTYFGVWKDIRKNRRIREAIPKSLTIPTAKLSLQNVGEITKRYLITFDDSQQYECKEGSWMAKVKGGQVTAVRPSDVRKWDLIVHFTITFDKCFEALWTIPEARDALNEVKWASKAWRNWLKKSIEILVLTKHYSIKQAREARYKKLLQLVQSIDPTNDFVQFQRFEQWLDKPEKPFFPGSILHLGMILSAHLNQMMPADRPARQAEMERIMAAQSQSASFREVITKLNSELTHYLITNNKGKLLVSMPDKYLENLLKTRADRFVRNIQPI